MVLFDEVDKAHPDTLTIMLQLFDEVNFFNPQIHIFDSSTYFERKISFLANVSENF